jgi:Putative abortive phage resistance protein AbiGi, antitoxin
MVPMVSFCDIPVLLSSDHRNAYGSCAIGLNKEWGQQSLTPVFYVNDEGPIAAELRKFFRHALYSDPLQKELFGAFWRVLAYMKPTIGWFPEGSGARYYTGLKQFDEEMEWRFVPPAFADSVYPEAFYGEAQEQKKIKLNEATFTFRLTFGPSDVETIIVEARTDAERILSQFPCYESKVLLWSDVS